MNKLGYIYIYLGLWFSAAFKEAIECSDESLALNADNADSLNLKGAALNALEKYDEAMTYLDRAIEINNKSSNNSKPLTHVAQDTHEELPNNLYPWSNKGWTLLGLKKYDEAIECFYMNYAI